MFEGLRFQHWRPARDGDGIVELVLDRAGSPVNALSTAVLDELAEIVERLSFEPPAGVLIRSGKDSGFVAGADLREFEGFARNGSVLDVLENGQRVFRKLSRLPCPSVAAIHGYCMGGGTEMALACRHRVASDDPSTRIGLPEVKLGIFPGWGGSARLPRLIGAPAALELMLTGRSASAANARNLGLVDRVVNEPVGGAHRDPRVMARLLRRALGDALRHLQGMSPQELVDQRLQRVMSYGRFQEVKA